MNAPAPASIRHSTREAWAGVATVQFVCLLVFTVITVTARWHSAYIPIVLALAGTFFGRERIRFPAPFWWGVALLAWAFISAFVAMSPEVAFATLETRLKVMLIFLVILNAIRSEKQLWIYLLVFLGSFMIYPARGTLINYAHGITNAHRVYWNGIYDNPNDLAAMTILAAGVALSIATAAMQSKMVRRLTVGCAAILILIVLITESRAGFLGLVTGMALPLLRKMRRAAIAFYAIVALCAGLAVVPHGFWVRMSGLKDLSSISTIREADKSGSAEQRWQIQKTAFKIFIDHPLLGVGLGCYPLANNKYRPDLGLRDAHDTYLRLAAELGLPGLLIWAALVVSVLKQVKRTLRGKSKLQSVEPIWLKYGLFGFLVAGIFGSYSDLTILYLVLGMMWSAATLVLREQNPESAMSRVARVP